MRPQFSKTIIIPVAALVLTLILAAIMFSPRPSVRVKVLDPRFQLISARMLRGTNDFLYFGNQLEGRIRDFLRLQNHLNVKPLDRLYKDGMSGGGMRLTGNETLAICFKWDSVPGALASPATNSTYLIVPHMQLLGNAGTTRVSGTHWVMNGNATTPCYIVGMNWNSASTNFGKLLVRISIEGMANGNLVMESNRVQAELEINESPLISRP